MSVRNVSRSARFPSLAHRITTPVEWAQRKLYIYVNIRVDDLKEPVIKIEKNRLTFK